MQDSTHWGQINGCWGRVCLSQERGIEGLSEVMRRRQLGARGDFEGKAGVDGSVDGEGTIT